MDSQEGRVPPQNIEAEQSVLGSLMLDKNAITSVADILQSDDFYRGTHADIYQAMLDLYEKSEPIDLVSLTNILKDRKQLETVGGKEYLNTLVNMVPTAAHALHYAKIVRHKKVLRDLIDASGKIAQLGFDEKTEADELVDEAEQKIFSISQKTVSRKFTPIKDSLSEAFERIDRLHKGDGALRGVSTGYNDLDNYLSGFQASDLVILAARPSMGKCLSADTEIINPITGQAHSLEYLVENKKKNILTLNNTLKISRTKIDKFVNDGKKPVFEVTTALGKKIKTTLTHPFLTIEGWKPLQQLKTGQRIAIPRSLPIFGSIKMPEYKIKVLAYLIADGGLTARCPHFTNGNKKIMADFKKAVTKFPNIQVKLAEKGNSRTPTYRISSIKQNYSSLIKKICQRVKQIQKNSNILQKELAIKTNLSCATLSAFFNGHYLPQPNNITSIINALNIPIAPEEFDVLRNKNMVTEWLESLELMGKLAIQKTIPSLVFQLKKKDLSLFLNRLFSCDGSIYINRSKKKSFGVSYSSSSKKLIKQVQHLLLRFGIISKIRQKKIKYKKSFKIAYELEIHNAENVLTFIKEIGIYGKEERVNKIKKQISKIGLGWTQDTLPIEIWKKIAKIKGDKTWRSIYKKMNLPLEFNIHAFSRHPRRQTVEKLAKALNSKELKQLAQSDIYWDRITNIEYKGRQQVYDLTIPKTHNFIANDFFVHNTSLALDFARNAAAKGIPVGIFSIEMSKEQLVDRLICSQAGIELWRMRTGRLSSEGENSDFNCIQHALNELSETPIYIDDTPSPTILQMRTMARRLQAEQKLGLIIIDYLQLIQPRTSIDSPVQQVTEISRGLKSLARELNIPVIALSQLNRSVETRTPAIPKLSDLRESGSLEQDSDVVMFIYREDKYRKDIDPTRQNVAEIHVAKHRNGPTGKIELYFDEGPVSFKSLEKQHQPEENF